MYPLPQIAEHHGAVSRPAGAAFVTGVLAALLVGCAGTAPTPDAPAPAEPTVVPESAEAAPERRELTGDVLYKLLVGEFAGRRGELTTSVQSYLDVARETGDPAVAERAVRIAVFARDAERGLEAAELWTRFAPDSLEAKQVHAALLLRAGRIDEAVQRLEEFLAGFTEAEHDGFGRVSDLLARERDKSAAVVAMRALVAPRENSAGAQFALAHLLARAGQLEESATVFERAAELDPDNERIVTFRARVQQRLNQLSEALASLVAYLERFPGADGVRMTYARMLVDAKRYDEARTQFETLAESSPDNADVRYALGLLLVQTNRLDEAAEQFEILVRTPARRDAAWYYLGQIEETRKELEKALAAYSRVDRGEHRLNAQLRTAVLMAELGRLDEARAHLHGLRGGSAPEVVRIYRAEAELLARRELYDDALTVYNAALEEFPQDTDLLYARAMLAEKMDELEILETDLRQILAREPKNADALNALGYTLADRTDRFEEAYELIKRAFALKPDDHYVVDSMGWILYRMGRHKEAVVHLRRAMSLKPDAEIAAHLGEVLWVMGDRDEAQKIWDSALETTPDDKRILDVKKRFGL